MAKEYQHLFIVGSPRSGTTWLQILIGAHPRVCTTVELSLFSQYTSAWIKTWNRQSKNIAEGRWNKGLPFIWTEEDFYGFLRMFIDQTYERVLKKKPQATHILDKDPSYSAHIDTINALIPQAKYIHIIRDGRDVAVSMVAAHRDIGFGTANIQTSALDWKHKVETARKAQKFAEQYLEIRYEDLLNDGVKALRKVYEFCDLSAHDDELEALMGEHQFQKMKKRRQLADASVQSNAAHYRKGKSGNWIDELKPVDRYLFHDIAGNLLCQLGYADDNWWYQNALQKNLLQLAGAIIKLGTRTRIRARRIRQAALSAE